MIIVSHVWDTVQYPLKKNGTVSFKKKKKKKKITETKVFRVKQFN